MAHTLHIYQSLWAMERRIPGQPEDPVEVHMERIAAAGYAGACVAVSYTHLTLPPTPYV